MLSCMPLCCFTHLNRIWSYSKDDNYKIVRLPNYVAYSSDVAFLTYTHTLYLHVRITADSHICMVSIKRCDRRMLLTNVIMLRATFGLLFQIV